MDSWLKQRDRAPTRGRPSSAGWAITGLLLGGLLALLWTAPAAWLADSINRLSQGRLLLLQAQGSVWSGQAALALGSGPGTVGVTSLPGRLHWSLRPVWVAGDLPALGLRLEHAGLLSQPLNVLVSRGMNGWVLGLQDSDAAGQASLHAPAAWLNGLGAPWNTLQPSGRISLDLEAFQWPLSPSDSTTPRVALRLQLLNAASRVSTLPVLGHYELIVRGGPELAMRLTSRPGSALVLEGNGRWSPGRKVEFRGQATAAPGREEALSNLLNIIGRRDGARSIIALGGSVAAPPGEAPRE